jgi:hypothetical protein
MTHDAAEVDPDRYQAKAKRIVQQLVDELHGTGHPVYVVWFCKTLQNWKALVSTDVEDGRYYEVTYDGDKTRAYVDTYVKTANLTFTDEDSAERLPE